MIFVLQILKKLIFRIKKIINFLSKFLFFLTLGTVTLEKRMKDQFKGKNVQGNNQRSALDRKRPSKRKRFGKLGTIFKKHIFLQKEHQSTDSDAVARKGRKEILAKNEIKIFFSIKFFIKRTNQKRDNSNEHHVGITNITFLFAFF